MTHPTNELRSSLRVAGRTAQQYGPTEAQINMIVALAQGSNNYNVMSGGRLTKSEASHIIEAMVASGAKPDWTRYAEVFVPTPRVIKAKKVERTLDIPAGARRVRHAKLGEGSVISEDEKAITVLFDGQKKPARMVPSFLTSI